MLPPSFVELNPAPTSPKNLQVSDYTFQVEIYYVVKGYQHRTKLHSESHTPVKLKRLYHPSKGSALAEVARECRSRHHADPSKR